MPWSGDSARLPVMSILTVAYLGDIYGSPGRLTIQQQLPNLRQDHHPDLIIANAENARAGSGLSPDLYHKIRGYGIDAITLGDHVFKDQRISSILESPIEPIARPANLARKAIGRGLIRLECERLKPRSLYIVPVLGRVFMNMPADDPFAAVDRILSELPEHDPIVIIEAHMEATSEKAAIAHYLDGRVAAVLGTHTHVPTADARILRSGTGFISDLGMCGPYNSVIGANADAVVHSMTTGMYTPFGIGSGDEAMCGVVLRIDLSSGRTLEITRVQYPADLSQSPFV